MSFSINNKRKKTPNVIMSSFQDYISYAIYPGLDGLGCGILAFQAIPSAKGAKYHSPGRLGLGYGILAFQAIPSAKGAKYHSPGRLGLGCGILAFQAIPSAKGA